MTARAAAAAKTDAVRYLCEELDLISVMAGHAFRATRAGTAVLHTRAMQRLIGLRQVGLAYMVWPSAENTRLSHSLGTEYWAVRLLDSLRRNAYALDVRDGQEPRGNRPRLDEIDAILGSELSLDLLVRLFALVHDIALLPLGHTLQYQLGFFQAPGAEARRARLCLQAVREQIGDAPEFLLLTDPGQREDAIECLRRHLDVVECCFGVGHILRGAPWTCPAEWVSPRRLAEWMRVLPFIYDLTHATVSADVIDFVLRDSLGAAMPRSFDERLLEYACVFLTAPEPAVGEFIAKHRDGAGGATRVYRFGLNAVRGRLRHEVVTGVTSVYRARYEIAERVFYNDAKCAADAMLDRALRLVDQQSGQVGAAAGPFAEANLVCLGDDQLLALVEAEERRCAVTGRSNGPAAGGRAPIMSDLLSRRLFQEVYRLSRLSDLPAAERAIVTESLDPAVRNRLEQCIGDGIPDLEPADLVVSIRPLSMQAKKPHILIGWTGGLPLPLDRIAEEEGYGGEALEIYRRYSTLWSLSVYLRPQTLGSAARVQEVCCRLFAGEASRASHL